jgi:hypothetical protein
MAKQPARIELDGRTIRYSVRQVVAWEIPWSSVLVLGEATNQNGPYLDDYFLCFACGPNGWYEASFYAEGREEFLSSLSSRLDTPLGPELFWSTDFLSNVLWPVHLAGKPRFKFTPVTPHTWFGRLLGPFRNRQEFSEEVLLELRGVV